MPSLRIPNATYRVQFTPKFGFEDARRIVPYLSALGITDLYASPILMARPGSQHGYDVADVRRLNPELGTPEEFEALSKELQAHGMGLLLDIVPNHMAASTENPWWNDVLENGPGSAYAQFFDIEWHSDTAFGGFQDRVLLPILGSPYGEALEKGELRIEREDTVLWCTYYDTILPLSLASYESILAYRLNDLKDALGSIHPAVAEYMLVIQEIEQVPPPEATDPGSIAERGRIKEVVHERLKALIEDVPEVANHIEENLDLINGTPGLPESFNLLDEILTRQSYRLAYWQLARERINYRRFFDINELISIRVDDESVFKETHQFILELATQGKVTGLRIDHIDGLNDPAGYLRKLSAALKSEDESDEIGGRFYVTVEKILAHGEQLPPDWDTFGTTGYDFLNLAGGLFVDQDNCDQIDQIYRDFTGFELEFLDLAYEKKRAVMNDLFPGVMSSLATWLDQIAERDRHGRDITLDDLQRALEETTACLSVYRSYIRDFTVEDHDRERIEHGIADARRRNPDLDHALTFIQRVLTLRFPSYFDQEDRERWLRFVMRWQQYSGPIMAKGYEDTSLYIFNRLLALNEVGGHPHLPGTAVAEFHQRNRFMQEQWPHTQNATSTHDTKRSEDVRSRISVLSEIPDEWSARLNRWSALNDDKRIKVDAGFAPDRNEEMLIYQTLVGAWPLDKAEIPTFQERMKPYLVKAAREAKVHTTWIEQNEEFENALGRFVDALFDSERSREFIDDLHEFVQEIALAGAIKSLGLTILKAMAPGVPDFYQGTDLWDLSLVDPDNRRPVDYGRRSTHLDAIMAQRPNDEQFLAEITRNWTDGRLKMFVIQRVLLQRSRNPELYAEGAYEQIAVEGQHADRVVAFARRRQRKYVLVIVPRLTGLPLPRALCDLQDGRWDDTWLVIPKGYPTNWHDEFTGRNLTSSGDESGGARLRIADLFVPLPAALLVGSDRMMD